MFSIDMILSQLSERMLKRQAPIFKSGVDKGSVEAFKMLEEDAKRNFSGANQLRTRTGYLRNSIRVTSRSDSDKVVGSIGSDAIYAAIHEFGGTVQAKASSYLQFKGDYGWIKAKQVIIPERPFLAPAIDRNVTSMKEEIIKGINKEI